MGVYDVASAAAVFDRVFDGGVWESIGPQLTCSEAQALMGLLVSVGLFDQASLLFEFHAVSDGAGDLHYVGGREEG